MIHLNNELMVYLVMINGKLVLIALFTILSRSITNPALPSEFEFTIDKLGKPAVIWYNVCNFVPKLY